MANTSIDLVGLDFNTLKSNFKTFLRNNTQFKDMDFEGSNINVLLDVLAYNTYLNGFYTNMVASEMFLDTAQLKDSVVSHSKELNYTPRSHTSSQASLRVSVVPTETVSTVVVPKYTSFSTRMGSEVYTFTTNDSTIATTLDGVTYTFDATVFEGVVTSETYVMDGSTTQRFVLSNPTVDTSLLTVTVYEDNGQNQFSYTQAHTLIGVTATSQVFFVQAAENDQYEIVFGDGVFGRRPKTGATVLVQYRATNGELPNGATTFVSDGAIDGHTNVTVTTLTAAAGGSIAETIESIRFNAPRMFVAQDRAVTANDYEVLLKARFPEIQAVSVYGGEEHTPPQYGRVFISADVADADGAPLSSQQRFIEYIKDKTPLTIVPQFINPEFLHVEIVSNVQYDVTQTTKTTNDIKLAVLAAITEYNRTNLNDFNTTLYYSQLVRTIDAADTSIVGNDTTITAIKEYHPSFGNTESFTVDLGSELVTEEGLLLLQDESHYGHTITSTKFISENQQCIILDDGLGTLYLGATVGDRISLIKSIGTVNYTTGNLTINAINVSSLVEGTYVKIFMKTKSKNISARKNTLLLVDLNDVTINVTGVKP